MKTTIKIQLCENSNHKLYYTLKVYNRLMKCPTITIVSYDTIHTTVGNVVSSLMILYGQHHVDITYKHISI